MGSDDLRELWLAGQMQTALVRLAAYGPRMTVGWKNTPYIVASGTARALVKRGLAEYVTSLEELARGGRDLITITERGRDVAYRLAAPSSSEGVGGP